MDTYSKKTIKEGKITIEIPIDDQIEEGKITKSMPVFYNETMTLNRDLTLLMTKIYSEVEEKGVEFFDTMAASGIRAIRLLKELDCVKCVHINDLNPKAIETIKTNIVLNDIDSSQYNIYSEDARSLLHRFRRLRDQSAKFDDNFCDIIDLDPFGTPSPYVPPAFNSIKIGGMLCVTATDTPVLFGIRKKQCVRKYITRPIKTNYLKELGTRILIYYIMKIAHLHELYIEPLLSISSDHFVRVFIKIYRGIGGVNRNLRECGFYVHCNNCGYREVRKFSAKKMNYKELNCPKCESSMITSGLSWIGKLHNTNYQAKLISKVNAHEFAYLPSIKKIRKYLELSRDEDEFPPYHYVIPRIAGMINAKFPSFDIIMKKIEEKGYNAGRTHFDPNAIKTTADISVIKEIIEDN